MEKLLKSYLSVLVIGTLISCSSGPYDHLSPEEKKQLSRDIWNREVSIHGFNGQYQGTPKSEKLLDEILALDPNNCDALREKSAPHIKRGIPHTWKPLFEKAVDCDPEVWQPWRGYLYLYFYRDYDQAIADFNASDTLTPNFIDTPQGQSVHYWRGVAYLGKSDYQNSINYFEKHIAAELKEVSEEWIDPSTFLYLGIAQYELQDYAQAITNLTKMLDYNHGNSADANYYLSRVHFETGNYQEAKDQIEKAKSNYEKGHYRYRNYVEEIRQIYPKNLLELEELIEARIDADNSNTEHPVS